VFSKDSYQTCFLSVRLGKWLVELIPRRLGLPTYIAQLAHIHSYTQPKHTTARAVTPRLAAMVVVAAGPMAVAPEAMPRSAAEAVAMVRVRVFRLRIKSEAGKRKTRVNGGSGWICSG
jgi:hypothetical protein